MAQADVSDDFQQVGTESPYLEVKGFIFGICINNLHTSVAIILDRNNLREKRFI